MSISSLQARIEELEEELEAERAARSKVRLNNYAITLSIVYIVYICLTINHQ